MVGGTRRKGRIDLLDLPDPGEEGDELMGARRQLHSRLVVGRIRLEEFGIVLDDHAPAGARGGHHVIEAAEGGDHVAGEGGGGVTVARIEGRLAAAGLGFRHLDAAACIFQQLDRRKADRRAEQVHQAGDEQGDAWRRVRHGTSRHSRGCGFASPRECPQGVSDHILVLRKASRSARSSSFLRPGKTILVFGTLALGFSMYLRNNSSVQTGLALAYSSMDSEYL